MGLGVTNWLNPRWSCQALQTECKMILVLLYTIYTCAFKPGRLMSHNWLHTPDCKVWCEVNVASPGSFRLLKSCCQINSMGNCKKWEVALWLCHPLPGSMISLLSSLAHPFTCLISSDPVLCSCTDQHFGSLHIRASYHGPTYRPIG